MQRTIKFCLLAILAMLLLAGNTIITRYSIDENLIDPVIFTFVRVISGALVLYFILALKGGKLAIEKRNWYDGFFLASYMVLAAVAYAILDAKTGVFIQTFVIQFALFLFSSKSEKTVEKMFGALTALLGFCYLNWNNVDITFSGSVVMILAGIAFAIYTDHGRLSDPLSDTAANFFTATPMVVLAAPFVYWVYVSQDKSVLFAQTNGVILASICGAVTSGIAYALWYKALKELNSRILSGSFILLVPIFATLGGLFLLHEKASQKFYIAATVIVIGLSIIIFCEYGKPKTNANP